MKVTAILATRGRPAVADATIKALRRTASGKHDLEVVLACDEDDDATQARFLFDTDVRLDVAPRPAGVGHVWNRVAGKVKADLILALPDDGEMLTNGWDAIALDLFAQYPWPHPDLAIAALQDTNSPGQATLFAMRPGWVRNIGYVFDTRYPFWFSDTAIQELWTFVSGTPLPFLPITVRLPAGEYNPRLRDMGLWWALFASSRQERLQLAAKVRAELGLPRPDNLAEIVAAHQSRDCSAYPDSIAIVRGMQSRRPPDAAYLDARQAALEYLQQHDAARHLTGERTAHQFALDTMEA